LRAPPPHPRRARRRGRLLAACMTPLLFVGFLLSLPAIRHALGTVLRPRAQTPTVALQYATDAVFFGDGVPWGVLRVDGELVAIGRISGAPLRLAPGHHTVDYHAAPFPHLRCTISVPRSHSDTCPLFYGGTDQGILSATRMIDLGATLDALPNDQRIA